MREYLLGQSQETGESVYIPKKALKTHLHLIGGTGKGKTTAIHTLLRQMWRDPYDRSCYFVIDRIGNLSYETLLWLTSEFCPENLKERVVYIEPAREDVVIGFNPLLYDTEQHGYFKVTRATDVILRAWENMNIEMMPRLARWIFNTFWAGALLGLTIADCAHFLKKSSPYHKPLLSVLPPSLQGEWAQIQHPGEDARMLESTRNRLHPYFESPVLRYMFASSENKLDVLKFMREGKIVILNLAPKNRLSWQLSDGIGGLVLNEIMMAARSLAGAGEGPYPTYVLLDEFQNFVGPDIESSLPETRQLGIHLILSHQSLSQLERGDYDLTSLIFQAQSRMIFGVQGKDADFLAQELASFSFDPMRVKDIITGKRQRIKEYRIELLRSWNESQSDSRNWKKQHGLDWSRNRGTSHKEGDQRWTYNSGDGQRTSMSDGEGGGTANQRGQGTSEHLVPVHEEIEEIVRRSYYSFDEWKQMWARDIRRRQTGNAFLQMVDDPRIYDVIVRQLAPSYLQWDKIRLRKELPEVTEAVEALIEQNFQSDLFKSPAVIDQEMQRRIERVVHPVTRLQEEQPTVEEMKKTEEMA